MLQKDVMTDARTALICARFNLRSGKRRLQKGLTREGLIALYDSVLFGMRYYITRHKTCASLVRNIDPWDAVGLFQTLARAGIFEDPRLFDRFSQTVERALWQGSLPFDPGSMLAEAEAILASLGVTPLDETGFSDQP
jgi:hypothetical protein